jgi:hypothetical protein
MLEASKYLNSARRRRYYSGYPLGAERMKVRGCPGGEAGLIFYFLISILPLIFSILSS